MDEKERIEKVDDSVVDINSIIDALRRKGYSADDVMKELKIRLEKGEITENDFREAIEKLEKEEKGEAEKLFDVKFI